MPSLRPILKSVAAVTIPVAAVVLLATPAKLSGPNVEDTLGELRTRILDLERDNAILRGHLTHFAAEAERNTAAVAAAATRLGDHESWIAQQETRILDQEEGAIERAATLERHAEALELRRPIAPAPGSGGSLEERVDELSDLLVHFRRDGDDVFIEGANLHVRNGQGATDTLDGRGNVIIGYNEARMSGNDRSGSHVLVLGARNNFTGFGGIVAGRDNDAWADWASVLGGTSNAATAEGAVVIGGNGNRADGPLATIVGGAANVATGEGAVVAGGGFNVSSGRFAVVGGGMRNDATGDVSVVSRGCDTVVSTCGGD